MTNLVTVNKKIADAKDTLKDLENQKKKIVKKYDKNAINMSKFMKSIQLTDSVIRKKNAGTDSLYDDIKTKMVLTKKGFKGDLDKEVDRIQKKKLLKKIRNNEQIEKAISLLSRNKNHNDKIKRFV